MKTWLILLGGLIIWALHFFALYGIGEFIGEGDGARWTVIGLTMVCLCGVAGLALLLRARPTRDNLEQWGKRAASGILLISFIAIIWQAFPALFVP